MAYCEPHLERAGLEVEAVRVVDETPLCASCYAGKPIHAEVEMDGEPTLREALDDEARRRRLLARLEMP